MSTNKTNSKNISEEMTSEEINFDHLINKINQLGKENDKNDFIKNYNDVKTKISIVDNILESKSNLDQDLSIDKLFEMLEQYNGLMVKTPDCVDLDIVQFKKVKDIIELIEKKISNKINIVEIK